MKEIKLTIDGKEIQLTDDQMKMLGCERWKAKCYRHMRRSL